MTDNGTLSVLSIPALNNAFVSVDIKSEHKGRGVPAISMIKSYLKKVSEQGVGVRLDSVLFQ